ncbi:MAG: TetR/AcrR family transcriptional regulator [Pseudomonadota bacterium]
MTERPDPTPDRDLKATLRPRNTRVRQGASGEEGNAAAPKSVGRKGFDSDVAERVIAATIKTLAAHGLEGVKARSVAKDAGIAVGSVYNLFGDLDALLRVANGRTYDELHAIEMRALKKAREDGASPRAQMLALAEAYLEFVANHQRRWLATLAFNRRQSDAAPEWYLEKELALFRIIEEAIADFPGVKEPSQRRRHARALWASVHGIVTIAVADSFIMQPLEEVWAEIEIIVNSVAASMEAA